MTQAFNLSQFANKVNTSGQADLTTAVTGTLPVANGGTGQSTYTNGQLLIGNTSGNTLTKATLTAGTNITITNGAGAITIAAASSAPTTAQVLTATTGYTAGIIGTFCVASSAQTTNIAVDATTAGSNIKGLNSAGAATQPFTGTWRNLGASTLSTTGFSIAQPLLVRIA